MRFPAPLVEARFVRRDNRFRATVLLDGHAVAAHVPNSGRLGELLRPGAPVFLLPQPATRRRTPFDLLLIRHEGTLVSVDARLPNPLFAEALSEGRLPEFHAYTRFLAEARRGDSRLDFLLDGPDGRCWVETKSCTLVEEGIALFPDAPTARGRRHLYELAQAASTGERAAVVFVVQREDAHAFAPHPHADADFALWLRAAAKAGVQVLAYICSVTMDGIRLATPIPVRL